MKVLDLFSGIGGFSLGLESLGFETVMFCEIEPYCREILHKHWPSTYIHDDIRTLSGNTVREHGAVELICGGFPCQDISVAGRGAGIDGERSGLWSEMHRLIDELRPSWVIAENVPALRTRGADRVIAQLAELDYSCWPFVVGAWAVGAPHKRDRAWIVAHTERPRLEESIGRSGQDRDGLHLQSARSSGECSQRNVADAESVGVQGLRPEGQQEPAVPSEALLLGRHGERARPWPATPGFAQFDWERPRLVQTKSRMGRTSHGVSGRMDESERVARVKALGNSVVPQVARAIGRTVMMVDKQLNS